MKYKIKKKAVLVCAVESEKFPETSKIELNSVNLNIQGLFRDETRCSLEFGHSWSGSWSGIHKEVYEIPRGIKTIGSDAFKESHIKTLIIPDTVKLIEWNSFNDSTINEIIFNDKDGSINNELVIESLSFHNCRGLSSIVFPPRLTSLKTGAFAGCQDLVSIEVNSGCKSYYSTNNGIYDEKDSLVMGIRGTILNPLCNRIRGAFYGSNIKSLKLDPYVMVNAGSFKSSQLEEITIGGDIIGSNTFSNCTSLKKVTLLEGIERLDSYLFVGAKNLKEITLPESIKYISLYAFAGSGINKLYIPRASEFAKMRGDSIIKLGSEYKMEIHYI